MHDLTTYEAAQQRYQELLQRMERERLIQTLPHAESHPVVTQTLGRLGRLSMAMKFWLRHQVALHPGLSGRYTDEQHKKQPSAAVKSVTSWRSLV